MKLAFETLDRLRAIKDCPDVGPDALFVMSPLWSQSASLAADGKRPPRFMEYRKYERTSDVFEGLPLFREVAG